MMAGDEVYGDEVTCGLSGDDGVQELQSPTPDADADRCIHERLDEEGICRRCGKDCRRVFVREEMHEAIYRGHRPMVVAVMLANGRPEMVKRAVASFCAQTYPAARRRLVVWNTGDSNIPELEFGGAEVWCPNVAVDHFFGATMGRLRNAANKYSVAHYAESWNRADLICHWDSDDWSHPLRIEEQVAAIASSKKECVGYRDLLFWDNRSCSLPGCQDPTPHGRDGNGAFRFTSLDARYLVGASMMYTVDAWIRYQFNEKMAKYEDQDWWSHNNHRTAGFSSFEDHNHYDEPRIICAIHDGNTSDAYKPEKMLPPMWKRVPEWDRYCFGRMR